MSRVFMPRLPAGAGPQWTVSALVQAVADALQARFASVAVTGEISGFTRASSGHWYFNLKDERAQVRCVMFRGRNALVEAPPRDGLLVELRAQLGVYEARGDLQLVVDSLRPAGQGALHERFLQLKAKLQAEGLFDAARKRTPARLPRGIAVVTSLQAAALHDVLSALARRAPHVPVWLFPAAVQGAQASGELVAALHAARQQAVALHIDTLLLVRGGGSLEDLWAFNDEGLARLLADYPVPVISGVGHETDFTIADFVADLRAPTPTAAAELAAAPRAELLAALQADAGDLHGALLHRMAAWQQRLDRAELALVQMRERAAHSRARLPLLAVGLRAALRHRLQDEGRQIITLATRLVRAPRPQVQQLARLEVLAQRLQRGMQQALTRQGEGLQRREQVLQALSPQRTLERGYSIVTNQARQVLRTTAAVREAARLSIRVSDGEVSVPGALNPASAA